MFSGGLFAGALQLASGLVEEDVVEGRLVELQVGDGDPLRVEGADDGDDEDGAYVADSERAVEGTPA